MDPEVAQTLSALEQKLGELERELGAVSGRQDSTATLHPSSPAGASPTPTADTPVFGVPSQTPAMLVDEAVEQRFSMEARETVYGEIPATKDAREAIDLAELVAFREKMQSTLQGLIDEYSRLLSLKPPSES